MDTTRPKIGGVRTLWTPANTIRYDTIGEFNVNNRRLCQWRIHGESLGHVRAPNWN